MRTLLGFSLLALMVAGAAGTCAHAQTYPARPVTFVVPFAPGGGTEFLARLLGQRLEQRLGKPFVIENRPGGGGVTGALSVARAAPDGYTILMAPSPVMAINVALHKKLPYDPAVDFVPVALVAATPYVLVVTPSLSVQSVADLVELAKAKPGQLSFASAGLGTHLGRRHENWIGMVAEVSFENGRCGSDNFRFVRHNACHETIFRRPADETEVLADLTARSKALGATLTAKDDRVYIAARDYSAN